MPPGSEGGHVNRLQDLLREAGRYNKPSTGIYDIDTISAIKELQASRGIEQDGIPGAQTLMLLYRSVGRFEVPRLNGGQE
jgi:peptidoglycan hydrolase-like protein with peptidoglycan-binding domain